MRKTMKPLIAGLLLAAASTSPAFAADGDASVGAQQQYDNALRSGEQSGWGIQEGTDVRASQGYGHNAGWDAMRDRAHQWRTNMANSFHRMTGTGSGTTYSSDTGSGNMTTHAAGTVRDDTTRGTVRSDMATGTSSGTYNGASAGTATGVYGGSTTAGSAPMMSDRPDPQAAPAAHSGQGVAPGPAAADAGRSVAGEPLQTNRDRGGPQGSGSKGTVDPTGVGAASMGGSPYGGNQDPNRPDAGSSSNNGNR